MVLHIKQKFSIQYSRGGATELHHKLIFSFKKITPSSRKANKEEQKKFINQYNGIDLRLKLCSLIISQLSALENQAGFTI